MGELGIIIFALIALVCACALTFLVTRMHSQGQTLKMVQTEEFAIAAGLAALLKGIDYNGLKSKCIRLLGGGGAGADSGAHPDFRQALEKAALEIERGYAAQESRSRAEAIERGVRILAEAFSGSEAAEKEAHAVARKSGGDGEEISSDPAQERTSEKESGG